MLFVTLPNRLSISNIQNHLLFERRQLLTESEADWLALGPGQRQIITVAQLLHFTLCVMDLSGGESMISSPWDLFRCSDLPVH